MKGLALDVPIVGQMVKVTGWSPTVVPTCQCPAQAVLIIASTVGAAQCPGCGNAYAISKILFDPSQRQCHIEIAHVQIPQGRTQ